MTESTDSTELTFYRSPVPTLATPKVTPVMESRHLRGTHHTKPPLKMQETRVSCEKDMNQYEDEDQQPVADMQFSGNETGGTDKEEPHEGTGNVGGNRKLVALLEMKKQEGAKEKVLSRNNRVHSYPPSPSPQSPS